MCVCILVCVPEFGTVKILMASISRARLHLLVKLGLLRVLRKVLLTLIQLCQPYDNF
jgi:hypothetical protein